MGEERTKEPEGARGTAWLTGIREAAPRDGGGSQGAPDHPPQASPNTFPTAMPTGTVYTSDVQAIYEVMYETGWPRGMYKPME